MMCVPFVADLSPSSRVPCEENRSDTIRYGTYMPPRLVLESSMPCYLVGLLPHVICSLQKYGELLFERLFRGLCLSQTESHSPLIFTMSGTTPLQEISVETSSEASCARGLVYDLFVEAGMP
jgi:hypothetical protein